MKGNSLAAFAGAALVCAAFSGQTIEYLIGTPQQRHGMEITAVYLHPILMEPDGCMRKPEESDVRMEADVRALCDNPNGFAEGEWIPHLIVRYEVTKLDTGETIKGDFMPMVANDGPRYGDNVKLMGPAQYRVKYTISPPSENQHTHFGRHTDRLTGVRPWFKTFETGLRIHLRWHRQEGGLLKCRRQGCRERRWLRRYR